jgi:hemolysin activation/secretion protein
VTPARVAQADSAAPKVVPSAADVPPPPRFDITRFDVQGNTLLSEQEIDLAVAPYQGKSKDFADVQRALESLQLGYQRRGFGTVQVLLPEQELERGVIVLRVIEPKLGKVTVEGNKFFDAANVRRSLPGLKEGSIPNANDIGIDARMASENPAKRTTVLLRAGENEGEVNATVRVQDERPWRALASLDNTGTPATGNWRLGVAYQHANMHNKDHVLSMQYILDPEPIDEFDRLKIFGLAYRIPFYGRRSSLDFIGAYSSVGGSSGQVINGTPFGLSGSGTFFGVRWNYLLPRIRGWDDYEHRVTIGAEYKAYTNQLTELTGANAGMNLTPDVTVYPVSITYTGSRKMERATLDFYLSAARNMYPHGPDAFRERFTSPPPADGGVGAARGVGNPYYAVYRYGVNYLRALQSDVQLRFNMTGQYSWDALVPGEQFGIGGWESLRGMLERETANDRGYRMSFEAYTPELAPLFYMDGGRLRFLVFLDTGRVMQNKKSPPCQLTECGVNATSIGFGMRLAMRNGFSVRLDFGRMKDAGAEGDKNDDRIHFGMSLAF